METGDIELLADEDWCSMVCGWFDQQFASTADFTFVFVGNLGDKDVIIQMIGAYVSGALDWVYHTRDDTDKCLRSWADCPQFRLRRNAPVVMR